MHCTMMLTIVIYNVYRTDSNYGESAPMAMDQSSEMFEDNRYDFTVVI